MKDFQKTLVKYKALLEISYISTAILCISAVCVAPELMTFLYTEKYISGLKVFIVYIIVDINFLTLFHLQGLQSKYFFLDITKLV